MLKEYYADFLDEDEKHLEKRKELIEACIEIVTNAKVDDLVLADYITEVPVTQDKAFVDKKKFANAKESVATREIHDFVKSYKRLDYFYNLDRSFFYSEAESEYNNMDQLLDFHRSTIVGKLS